MVQIPRMLVRRVSFGACFALIALSLFLSLYPSEVGAQTETLGTPADTRAETTDESAESASPDVSDDLDDVYLHRLKGVEERVNSLKEKVFRSKARLLLLRETVLHGVVSGAKAVLYHVNDLGASYTMESATYYLDGSRIFSRSAAEGGLDGTEDIKIFEGSIPPGNHTISVELELRGNGLGVFPYLNRYSFTVRHTYNFIAEEGRVTRLRIIAYEKKGLLRSFEERPSIRYDLVTDRNVGGEAGSENAQ